jgi:predicted ABC-type ATPase
MARPVLFVLAGVNGAGKSSIGGFLLAERKIPWFNPDAFARELIAASGCDQEDANAAAWQESLRRLDEAVAQGRNHAFETTLGGHTVAGRIRAATRSHDVIVWLWGLPAPEDHIRRVAARVKAGGHDIPETRIRERYPRALQNVIALMPHVAILRVYDNSVEAPPGTSVPDPVLVLEMERGRLVVPRPDDAGALAATPDWAKPLVEAAIAGRHGQKRIRR